MKRKALVVGIIVLLISIVFNGCSEVLNSETNKFVGTWNTTDNYFILPCDTIVFLSNGTFKYGSYSYLDNSTTIFSSTVGTWDIEK